MAERARGNIAEFTVTELSGAIKRAMEENFGYVRLRGEISGYRGPHSSGHAYFALKDDRAKIEAVVWKGVFGGLAFKPEEGLEVIATGKVSTFPGTSKYQIVIESLEPAGAGALMALLEERKKKLAAEGLFDDSRKKPLPFLPQIVGIITSPTGAVIRDMLHGFTERFPMHVILWPVRCQGETCAAEVSAAIRGFNRLAPGGRVPRPDVLIVARGGGAVEDLWGYNEEILVRAVGASDIPIISAVGHETDWTLIDLAADARAPTPTKAAEWAAPKYSELLAKIAEVSARLNAGVFRQVEVKRASLKSASRGLPRPQDLLSLPRQRFDSTASRLERSLSGFASASRGRMNTLAARLNMRLLTTRIERAGDKLTAFDKQLATVYARALQRRRIAFTRPSGRLQPGLLRYPAQRGRDRLDAQSARASRGFTEAIARRRHTLNARAQLLNSLGYKNVLERGFAVVRDSAGAMVRRTEAALQTGALEIQFADGRVAAHTSVEVGKKQPAPAAPVAKQLTTKERDQGSLL
ncbi:MAG: exodeoxyribonuclease VII large subunit [Hyphomicrobiales bacterium]|nr:exodeoxyribonuclease VII large subunit [Hyphomicrobiales bacterium]